MKSLIALGKFKNPEILKKVAGLIEGTPEEIQAKFISSIGKKFDGFLGGNFLVKEDGTFIDQTFWESQEHIEKIMESDIVKTSIAAFDTLIEGEMSIDYFDVPLHYPAPESVMAK